MSTKNFSFLHKVQVPEAAKIDGEYVRTEESGDIAIIGISCRLPMADNYREFCDLLAAGASAVRPFPEARRHDAEKYLQYTRPSETKFEFMEGAYLERVDHFDFELFRITPREASLMNPNQRIFLETALECLEDAGYAGDKISGTNTGVYAGYIGDFDGNQYRQMLTDTNTPHKEAAVTGNMASIIPGRISYLLDLKGPSMLVDTACSSSLVAVHLACGAIRNGDCDMALAGGVKTNLLPLDAKVKIGIESSAGITRAFDDEADGTGIGEGAAALLLKPLHAAVRDRDYVYAVIKGSAVNQDGSSIGITAPNVAAQTNVIIKAWQNAGIDPETISYIEAHGTGTKLGDPIEMEGVAAAFKKYTGKRQFCGIGSVKSNIGHLYDCAGIASMIKLVLALQHREIPASIHFTSPNKNIDFLDSPVYVVKDRQPWRKPFPLRAGISSFGFSGTNCHVVLEEAPKQQDTSSSEDDLEIFTVSAHSKRALIRYIDRYYQYLTDYENIHFKNLCYTANTGRKHYAFRIAIIAKNAEELKIGLNRLLDGSFEQYRGDYGPIYYGHKPNNYGLSKPHGGHEAGYALRGSSADEAAELARSYAGGRSLNWRRIYGNEKRFTIPLPTYPFEKERCWLEIPPIRALGSHKAPHEYAEGSESEVQHPSDPFLLHGRAENEPYTAMERLLGQIWCEELGYRTVNIHRSFYDMGGDSILATKIVNRLNQQAPVPITIADVLKRQTICELASFMEAGSRSEEMKRNIEYHIEPLAVQDHYALSSAQKRIYILHQMNAGETTYNMPFSIQVEGMLDYDRLERAMLLLVERHEAFRTTFHHLEQEQEPVQRVSEKNDFALQHRSATLEQLPGLIDDFIVPFDLSKAPLLRAILFHISAEHHVLLIDMHHIISDGASLSIFMRDFMELYAGMEPEPLLIQYKDFAAWQNKLLQSPEMEKPRAYWLNQYSGDVPKLQLPTDFVRPVEKSYEGHVIEFRADHRVRGNIAELCAATQSTLFMTLLSAYFVLLFKYSGQEDIVVGSPISGRRNGDADQVIGMFVNMLPIRNFPSGSKSVVQFLSEVKESALSSYERQDFQFEQLIEQLALPREASRHPLFDTVFALQDGSMANVQFEGLKLQPFSINRRAKFDLTLQAFEREDEIFFTFEYCTRLFREETIRTMAQNYLLILEQMSANKELALQDLKIEMPERAEIAELAAGWKTVEFDF
ncbi:condensation domain-containing protein [Paenibacillus melissococcoides]|uniref:Condensation domain-containing protein n=1 Tax=Paenibacillus melissococcoides TaxID=2912268 RepID=A0ABN8U2B2_9BACL|nr:MULTISPECIES: condensation domain-containing protein [Paenibacillus]MEB9895921.1 condensation domain-containing protein [Bacillus cereus]CAH8243391.1 condensation domain-containing protein [Paenibacillus melissococcoides]CAH8704374.1 condensation domain-containing protein [Paenibacillus melissococcoides]CAH8707643.1 condensation domain-containing protein [Paenibacillus melissococcoides]GIO80237.1 polyketide synthase [Paenibacillus dendritiformis]